jgi:hypothetical protein
MTLNTVFSIVQSHVELEHINWQAVKLKKMTIRHNSRLNHDGKQLCSALEAATILEQGDAFNQ